MNEQELFSQFWRERCNDAFDSMRDDLAGGRAHGRALAEQGEASRNMVMQQAGHLVLAFAALRDGQAEQAQKILQLRLLQMTKDDINVLLLHYVQALIYSNQGRYQLAYEYSQQHLLPLVKNYSGRESMRALLALGVFAAEYNQPEEAMRRYFNALELVDSLRLPKWWRAHINANIAEILCHSGNAEDAEPLLIEAMQLANQPDKAWLQTYVATIFAVSQLVLGKYESAYSALAPQVEMVEMEMRSGELTHARKCTLCLCICAYTLAARNRLEEAERLFALLEAYAHLVDEQQHRAYVCWVRGHLLHQRGHLEKAAIALNEAVEALGKVDLDFMPLRVHLELSEIYGELGQWQNALFEHQQYHALYERAQGKASRMHMQIIMIQSELREAETARLHAEKAMSERRELAENLRHSLAERDTILENSMVGIAFLNPQGQVRWSNATLANIFGIPEVDLKNSTLRKYFANPADYARTQETVRVGSDNHGGKPFEDECRMLRGDGSVIWVYLSGRAVPTLDANSGTVWVVMDITRRHQLEADLNRSEEHYRLVVENAVEGIAVVQDNTIVFANPFILELTDVARGEIIGTPFLPFIHPDDREGVIARYKGRLQGLPQEKHHTFRTIRPYDDTLRWVETSAVLIEWEGRPATVMFINDVTERKKLQDNLKESLRERETILENSMVGIAFLNAEGRVKWANMAMLQMFGGELEEHIGKSLEPMYPSRQEYLATGALAAQAVGRGESFSTELQMRRADGSLFWATLSGRAVNQGDLSLGTVWAMVDIDQRRKLEQELAKSEEHHRQVVDNVTEGIMVVQDGKIVFANPRVLQISGRSHDELFQMSFLSDVHPDDVEYVIEQHRLRAAGLPCEKSFCFRIAKPHSNEVIWIENSVVVIEWEGRPASLSFLNDVTGRRNLEESLRQSHLERVHLQTLQFEHELREAELARHHAEETTRAKSMFLANMSHEIRTPMNAIIGMAHLALCTGLSPKQRDYVEKIHGAGISLLGIINDILDFSRIEAGKLNIEMVEFNLDKVLNNLATVTSEKAREKELQYQFQIPPRIPHNLIGDPLRLGQVLINLVNNSIKFTERGGVYLSCQICETVENRILLEFIVRDTGIGMQEDHVAKLFHAFSQADESTTRKYGGTGLGLSIAKGMVELMGGKIWLESTPGVGTVMHFTAWFGLPEQVKSPQILPTEINGMRVLVVDDNPVARLAFAEILSNLPLEVDYAFGATEALIAVRACAEQWPYGIVFIAVDMQGIDRLKLVRELREDVQIKNMPQIVLISELNREVLLAESEKTVFDGFLNRPVNASQLIDCLMDLFASKQAHSAFATPQDIPMFHDLTVLLVEDNDINQMIATELLQAVGIKVEVANNGKVALETLQSLGPDYFGLVFMDVQMPEMDGHEATEKIRHDARFANLPIIAMTAHAMVEERNRCLDSGMNDHISKPINPGEFYHIIGSWCSKYLSDAGETPHLSSLPILPSLSNGAHLHELEHAGDASAADAETTANKEAEVLKIAGLNVADGLSRMLGDQNMYMELLSRFRDGQQEVALKIRAALANDEYNLAERFAHTLKGVAAMIGAQDVQHTASDLEQACRQGAAPALLESQLQELDQHMHVLLGGIQRALVIQQQVACEVVEQLDRVEVQQVMNGFARYLQQNDGDAIDFLAAHSQLLAQAIGADAHRRIVRATRQFDFDLALEALEKGAQAANFTLQYQDQNNCEE